MTFLERLEQSENLLCLGLDPVASRIPSELGKGIEAVERFLTTLLEQAEARNLLPSTLKPNLAYFEQYGWRGWQLLEKLVARWSSSCLMVLDCKRGDIGRSSTAYAKAMYETLGGDAVTLHPWMGPESIAPFAEYFPEKGGYLLLRTSNPGSVLLQNEGWPRLFDSIDEWDTTGCLGYVVGATRPEELEKVLTDDPVGRPLLIPGVGAQGGKSEHMMALIRGSAHPRRHRINVSSDILYAHEKGGAFPEASLKALESYQAELTL